MNKKEQILTKFYDLHERPSKIAKELEVTSAYITKIIKSDIEKYKKEKDYRSSISAENRKQYKANWNKTHKKSKEDKELDEFVKLQHIQASEELSYHCEISDEAFRKWNPSLYHYTKSGNLVIDRNLKVSSDIPKKIKTNIKLPTQKYKRKYVYSY